MNLMLKNSTYFWTPVPHITALLFSVIWLALKNSLRDLNGSTAFDFGTEKEASPPPPSNKDFLSAIPRSNTALYVLNKIEPDTDRREDNTDLSTLVNREPSDPETLSKFSRIGDSKLISLLGSGGMADVYLAWNPRLEVYRAIKVVKPGQPQPFLERFETEVRIASKLNHQNIVHCYSITDWFGLPAVEMEYVNGTPLEKVLLSMKKLSAAHCLAIAILVCRALHYAHTQNITLYGKTYNGIIHRDIKPANIILSCTGAVKLADFGLARPGSERMHTKFEGNVVGTIPFLAPEQLEAKGVVSPQTDLYLLGVTLFELLTGKQAFPQKDMGSLFQAKKKGAVNFSTIPGLPKKGAQVLSTLTAVNPDNRFPSAEAACKELEAVLALIIKGSPAALLRSLADRCREA